MTNQINEFKLELKVKFSSFGMSSEKRDGLFTIEYIKDVAESKGDWVANICDTVLRTKRISDKQAYCIARFAVESNALSECQA